MGKTDDGRPAGGEKAGNWTLTTAVRLEFSGYDCAPYDGLE